MAKNLQRLDSVFEAVAEALDLGDFLSTCVEYGVAKLDCDGGSVYLFDGATKTLQHKYSSRRGHVSVILELDEGIVGKGLTLKNSHVFTGDELSRFFLDWGRTARRETLRAILTVPVFFRGIPQAVFCFDFESKADTLLENDLTVSEKERIQKVAAEIEGTQFANAVNRIRINQARLDIKEAGAGPARLRQAVADYLTSLLAAFTTAKEPAPQLAYVQLVDRRRGLIRTFQGVGMPLIFQTSLSHSLESDDIQAQVSRDCNPILSVGPDPLLDPVVYERFEHDRLVRLWLPLFPFPTARLVQRPVVGIEALFRNLLRWSEVATKDNTWRRAVASWDERLSAHPPSNLVFGTLELGYDRVDRKSSSFEPLSLEFASWCAAKAYELSEELFEVTLSGSLDKIGKAVARTVFPYKTRLALAMPSWRSPEIRSYPASADWPAAIPAPLDSISPPPGEPARVEILTPVGSYDFAAERSSRESFHRLESEALDAVRVALRLDDHVADLHTLVDETDRPSYFGTEYPDPKLGEILQEICREAAADRCAHFLLEKKAHRPSLKTESRDAPGAWRLMGKPHLWPFSDQQKAVTAEEYRLANRVAEGRIPTYEKIGGLTLPVAALPIELSDQTQAVILLYFPMGSIIDDETQRELEGRVSRWVYRLSLRNLIVTERFARLVGVGGLRGDLAEARTIASANESGNHLRVFVKQFLSKSVLTVKALAGLLILYSESETASPTVNRFWCCTDGKDVSPVDSNTFVGKIPESPGRKSAKENVLILYRPDDPDRSIDTKEVNQELNIWAEKLESQRDFDGAIRLKRIVRLAANEVAMSTMVIIPVVGQARDDRLICGALTYILRGDHDLSENQRSLLIEIGRIVAETLGRMRGLDSMEFEKSLAKRLDDLRSKLADSRTHDEVIGHFLSGIGKTLQTATDKSRWMLADHVVVWMLAPGYREMVVRSGRGMGLTAVEGIQVISPKDHPLISRTFPDRAPKKDFPSISEFKVWNFDLKNSGQNYLLDRYASLPGCNWLVSFPLMQADSRVIAVVDCLREKPLPPEEEAALPAMLRRLSQQVCFALERCRFERVTNMARELTYKARKEVDAFHSASVYQILVTKVRDELGVTHCDLLLDRDDVMLLHASTRFENPIGEKKRQSFRVKAQIGREVIGDAYGSCSSRLAHAASVRPAMSHLSPDLEKILNDDWGYERLAIPLGQRSSESEPLAGILYLRGPISTINQGRTNRKVKKSGFLTFEHLLRAQDLAWMVYWIAMMARMVERKGWLIGELQHQLGQPLQILRGWCDDRLRDLAAGGVEVKEMSRIVESLRRRYDLVHDVRNKMATYANISQPLDTSEFSDVRIAKLLGECCRFMQPEAERKGCYISYDFTEIGTNWGNPTLLKSAFLNLLQNAIKYSYNDRGITVTMQENPEGIIQIVVANYGVGIPPQDLKRIFQPYFRSKVPDEKGARPGSGIGLAIVWHAIVVVHAGQIAVNSIPPKKINDHAQSLSAEETAKYPHKTTFILTLKRQSLDEMKNLALP